MSFVAEWTVEVEAESERLDRYLALRLDCSRARARDLLEHGAVELDGRRALASDKGLLLEIGQRVRILESPELFDRLVPVQKELDVLAEGPGWVAVNKPAGLPVHPLRHDETDTLLQRVIARWPMIDGVGEGGLRSGVVHRLDLDTSGVQLFALEEPAWQRFRDAFRGHRIDKLYRAIVHGVPEEHGKLELDLEIVRHRPARVRAVQAGAGGPSSRRCPLRWRLREELGIGSPGGTSTARSIPEAASRGQASLIDVRPSTGFLHQIRVSFSWIGHPILGDRAYAPEAVVAEAPRQMLHAARLALGEVEAEAPDPADFAAVLARLRGGA